VLLAYSYRKQLFGTAFDTPVRIATVVALVVLGWAIARDIGRAARIKIEKLVDAPVYLDLWVKVLPNWRRNAHSLKRFGYTLPEDQTP